MHTPVIMPGKSEAGDCVSTVQKIQVIKQAGSHHVCSLLSITCELQVFFPPLVLLTQQPTSLLSPRHQWPPPFQKITFTSITGMWGAFSSGHQ